MIDNDVTRAFGSLERFAPAEDAVLAGFRDGVGKRRRRHQAGSVVAVAAAAGAVALGVVLVSPGTGGQAPNTAGGPPASPTSPAEVTIATAPAPPALPFTVAGLPAGYRLDAWDVSPNESSAQYVGDKDFQVVVVWVSKEPHEAVPGATDEPTTVAGRPATLRRFDPNRAEQQLLWQLDDGRWVLVGGRAPQVPLAALRTVAENLSFTPTPLPVSVPLTVLPDGYQVASWNGGGTEPTGSLMLCRAVPASRRTQPAPDCLSLSQGQGTAPLVTLGKRSATQTYEIPIDQAKVVNGVTTRATADGTLVVAQLDANRWVQAYSKGAGVDVLRNVITSGIK
jgi:hypothetical protein